MYEKNLDFAIGKSKKLDIFMRTSHREQKWNLYQAQFA